MIILNEPSNRKVKNVAVQALLLAAHKEAIIVAGKYMRYESKRYSFELPDSWKNVVSVKESRNSVIIRETMETGAGHSGIVVTLKSSRKRLPGQDGTEFLGTLVPANGSGNLYLYALYGAEGSCSEEAADLYWRLVDKMPLVFRSIQAAEGYTWEGASE